MRPRSPSARLELGGAHPAAHDGQPASARRASPARRARRGRARRGAVEPAAQRLEAADHARAAAEGHDGDARAPRTPRARRAPRRGRAASARRRARPRSRRRAGARGRDRTCRGRAARARRGRRAGSRRSARAPAPGSRGGLRRARPRARRAPRARPSAAELALQPGQRRGGQRAGVRVLAPAPAAHLTAHAAPPGRRAPRRARFAVARRTMKPPKRAEPRSCWRTTSVTRVPLARRASSSTSVLEAAKTRSNGVPSSSCAQRPPLGRARVARTRKSARTSAPSSVRRTSVKRSRVTASTRVTRGHQRGRWCGSPTVSHTRSARRGDRAAAACGAASTRRRSAAASGRRSPPGSRGRRGTRAR